MFCALVMVMLSMENCMPPPARPLYAETFAIYGPAPDCMNRDRHIRYLERLKTRPTQGGDNQADYDQAIDIYINRLEYYCQ